MLTCSFAVLALSGRPVELSSGANGRTKTRLPAYSAPTAQPFGRAMTRHSHTDADLPLRMFMRMEALSYAI